MRCKLVVISTVVLAIGWGMYGQSKTDDLIQVFESNGVDFNSVNGVVEALGNKFIIDNNTLFVTTPHQIEELRYYAKPIGTSIGLWEETDRGFSEIHFNTPAPNLFQYSLSGMQWSPEQALDDLTLGELAFVHVQRPPNIGLDRLAWLVTDQGQEVPLQAQMVLPSSVARRLPPPVGYRWRHRSPFYGIPDQYNWYVPKGWEDGDTWVPEQLDYEFLLTQDQLAKYGSLPDEQQVEYVAKLISDSIGIENLVRKNPTTIIPLSK